MSAKENFIPVDSDVNDYLDKSRVFLDNEIADVFKELRLSFLLKIANIIKRSGHTVFQIVYDLFLIPFLAIPNVFLFAREQFEKVDSEKNRFYRFLENAKFNWRQFQLNLSKSADRKIQREPEQELFFVIDDTITQVTGKLVELASYIYDHTIGKSVLGFQKLVLGLFDGHHFIPIGERICTGKKKPKAKTKAKKYNKIPKAERIAPNSPGALERAEIDQTKLEKALSMLKTAIKKGFSAKTVLFDSWYCFNCFIVKIVEMLKLHVICQLKNMPKTNKYLYKGKSYSLKELFGYVAKPKLRMVKKYQLKQAVLTVAIPNSKVKLKIVFVQNEGAEKWHAFAATDTKLTAKKILEAYSQRWSIEVFFKNCKQYLNYGKEQMSNLDSIIASDAMVFMRYTLLTYLASKQKARFYEKFDKLRSIQKMKCFGMRLLQYFLNKLQFIIREVCQLIENDHQEKALELLKNLVHYSENLDPIAVDLK
ncbi:MAG: transposase [Dehalococcoidia bacterium]